MYFAHIGWDIKMPVFLVLLNWMVKKKKQMGTVKKAVIGLAGVGIASVAFLTVKSGNHKIILPAYQAVEVIDGDSFITAEKQRIRLAYVDAPEIDLCGGKEAKETLEKLVLNRPLYIKVIFKDANGRLIGDVYNLKGSIAEQMASSGWAYRSMERGSAPEKIKEMSNKMREKNIGVFSSVCTQNENLQNSKCVIKGNNLVGENTHLYRYPDCGQYGNTQVQLYLGDEWFCSEKEAEKAGYVKGSDCP
jgi:endonuclease YncB( thermonuclease family)